MCHGHPHTHSCGHQSVTWHYCPSAVIDLTTGYETPCQNITFAASQSSSASCPLANCDFQNAGGGGWTCCQCGGRNSSGWCNNMRPRYERNPFTGEWDWFELCDHGCCLNCIKDGELLLSVQFNESLLTSTFCDSSLGQLWGSQPQKREERERCSETSANPPSRRLRCSVQHYSGLWRQKKGLSC
ncbi:hypothetical protein VTJ49DRAFT_6162 [Mycothermus thermophilus]|uniref:Uncharacterized protein n=1 Tax=Humicola insolens TaxID=85995 RepID=A0ABR3V1T4_HUMIN